MATGGRPSGWYQDPSGRPNSLRWWDGSTWTEDYRSTSDFVRSSTVSPQPSSPAPPPFEPEVRAAEPTAAASAFGSSGAPANEAPSWTPPSVAPTPVQFEVVEPDRTKRRVIITVVTVVLVLIAGVGGFVIGTSGDDDKGSSAGSTSGPPSAPAVTVPNLVGWWKLADGQGLAAADATGKQPAGVAGAVDWSQDKGGSIVLAENGSLATARSVVDTTKSFTVSAWAKLSAMDGNKTVVAQDGANVSGFYLHYNHTADTWAFVRTSDDTASPKTWYTALATAPVAKDTWTHLVGVYDATAGQITLYVDGQPQKSVAAPTVWKADGPLTIGRAKNNSDLFTGGIADVEVFDRVLTAEEIKSLPANPGLAN